MDFFSLPQILGYVAYTISLTAAMQKNDKLLFLLFAVSNLIFSVHHFMLGNVSAALSKIVVGMRMYANIYFKGAIVAFPFAFIAVASGYYGYKNFYSLLPVAAVLLATFVAAYSGGIKLRICFIVCCSLWLVHDVAGRSIGGSIEDVTSLTIYSVVLRQMIREQKRKASETAAKPEKAA